MGLLNAGALIIGFIRSSILDSIYPCLSPASNKDSKEKIIRLFGVHIFKYQELEVATNNFDPKRKLGTGGYSTVYLGELKDGRTVAIKSLGKMFLSKEKRVRVFKNEAAILARLNHKNLVQLYGCSSSDSDTDTNTDSHGLLLVEEYVPNGTLADHLHGTRKKAYPGALPWANRLNIAVQIASALTYLHGLRIVHRDVKTSNILLDNSFNAKVADFGLSRLFPDDVSHVTTQLAGSCGYIDPQYGETLHLTPESDVYSFGVVMMELISSRPPFCGDGYLSVFAVDKILDGLLDQLVDPFLGFEHVWISEKIHAVGELAFRCLQHDRCLRPSMAEVWETLESIRDGKAEMPLTWGGGPNANAAHQLTNAHIVSRLPDDYFERSHKPLLVYEYASNGTLSSHVHGIKKEERRTLPWFTRLNIAIQTASALAYLHDSGIIHRDVKSSNILLDENLSAKVADFGLLRSLPLVGSDYGTHVSTTPQGTHGYMDPDYWQLHRVSVKSDVYSFGVVLCELISSKRALHTERINGDDFCLATFAASKIQDEELHQLVDPSLGFDSDNEIRHTITTVAELAFLCLQCPKDLRPSMKQVLETLEGIREGNWGFYQIT